MNPPSVDVKDLLNGDSSLGLTFGVDLFVSEIPETTGLAVGLFDYGGMSPEVNYTYERPNVQVVIRGAKSPGAYVEAHKKAQAVRDFLIAQRQPILNGARYIGIWALSDVSFIGYDENHRPQVTVNFRLHRTTSI